MLDQRGLEALKGRDPAAALACASNAATGSWAMRSHEGLVQGVHLDERAVQVHHKRDIRNRKRVLIQFDLHQLILHRISVRRAGRGHPAEHPGFAGADIWMVRTAVGAGCAF